MLPSDRQKPYLLSQQDHEDYYKLIKRDYLDHLVSFKGNFPGAIYLGGQPGSGKTLLRNRFLNDLEKFNATVVINVDDLREYHPDFKELLAKKETNELAPYLVNPDSVLWANRLKEDAIKKRVNIIFDLTLGGDANNYIRNMEELKDRGYNLFLIVMAVKQEMSRLGIHLRYESQLAEKGAGRFVSMDVHDKNYNNLIKNIVAITDKLDFKMAAVYKRHIYIHDNEIKNKYVLPTFDYLKENEDDKLPVDILVKAIERERTRNWTQLEKDYLKLRVNTVTDLIKSRGGNTDVFLHDIKKIVSDIDDSHIHFRKI